MTDLEKARRAVTPLSFMLLFMALVMNFADRQLFSVVQEDVKREFGLSDTELALLSGVAFNLTYIVAGIAIARLSDRMSRVPVIIACLSLWSLFTSLCATAVGFVTLFLYRTGVGIGEAGNTPAAHSILADWFEPGRRATAFGLYTLALPVGTMLAFLAGPALAGHLGWRGAFVSFGLPGILLAFMIALRVKEPNRRPDAPDASTEGNRLPLRAALLELLRRRALVHVVLGASFQAVGVVGVIGWLPPFLMRTYGVSAGEALQVMAILIGVLGSGAMLAGGWIADRMGGTAPDRYMRLPIASAVLSFPIAAIAFLVDSPGVAIFMLITPLLLGNSVTGSVLSLTQVLAPLRSRSLASACMLFTNGLIGSALSALLIGMVSDLLRPALGPMSLRYTLAAMSLSYLLAAAHYARAARHLRCDGSGTVCEQAGLLKPDPPLRRKRDALPPQTIRG